MELRVNATCVPVLLEACAKTLETLRFNVADGTFGAHSFPEFDLLRLKALRSLHIAIWVGEYSLEDSHRHTIVTRVYLTITSLVFSELVVVLRARATSYLLQEVALFEALRAMTRVRPFKLVFLLEAEDCIRGEAQRMLVGALESVIAKGLLDFLDSPPTVRLA